MKIIGTIIAALVFFTATAKAGVYYVTTPVLNVRAGPAVHFPVVNKLYHRQQVEVTNRFGTWVRITPLHYDERWVAGRFLSAIEPARATAPEPVEEYPDIQDSRLQYLPAVGVFGLTAKEPYNTCLLTMNCYPRRPIIA